MRKSSQVPVELGYRMPAEWEPHAATWLAWPTSVADWPDKGGAIPWVFAEIIRHLTESEAVRLLVPNAAAKPPIRALLRRAGADTARVSFVPARVNRTWARDYLPMMVTCRPPQPPHGSAASFLSVGSDAATKRPPRSKEPTNPPRPKQSWLGAVKWRFNGWARYSNHKLDEAAGQAAAQWLGVPTWFPEAQVAKKPHRVVLEGGAIDVDGEGTLLTTRECLLEGNLARNKKLGREGTEMVLAAHLDARKVIWLDAGIVGDDTSGHVDDFVRFVGPGQVVLCQEPDGRDANHAVLASAAEKLSGVRDAMGRKLEIVTLPMPAPLHYGRDRLPASYANFYIGNTVVLVPTFNDVNDRIALGILGELFPTRKVVGVHCVDLVLGLGTIHCSTMQEPLGASESSER